MEIASDEPDDDSVKIPVNESCFVVLAEVVSPNHRRDVSNWVEDVVEYKSRQSLDGKFLYLDPRLEYKRNG